MRGGNKSLNLYKMLSEQIKSGRLTCGDKLPQESEMALQYGVSQGTIRKAMQMLREDGMVERTRKKGTFITEQKTPAPITILLPCPNYLSVRCISTDTLLDILDGAMSAAARHGVRVETVPASTDNTEPETIDWQNLDFISSESRVIIYGLWYRKLFPFLRERRCRVALCHSMARPEILTAIQGYGWNLFALNNYSGGFRAVEYMIARGCRRIAMSCLNLDEPGHPLVQGYQDALRKHGLPLDRSLMFHDMEEAAAVQRQSGFNGLLMDNQNFFTGNSKKFTELLGIRPDTLVVFRHSQGTGGLEFNGAAMRFNFTRIGREMVDTLLTGFSGRNFVCEPEMEIHQPSRQSKPQNYNPEIILNI